jgi:hypothetical protein
VSLVDIYAAWLIVMNGRQRNATNSQIWGNYNDSNYDGNCTSRDCLSGTYEISGCLIFVEHSVRTSVRSKYSEKNILPLLAPSSLQQARPEGGYVVWVHLSVQLLTLQICTSQGTQAATLPRAWHFILRINSPNLCYWRITRKKIYFFFVLLFQCTSLLLWILFGRWDQRGWDGLVMWHIGPKWEKKNSCRVLVGQPEEKRPLARP